MNTTELMQLGRQQIKQTDTSLLRSEKVLNDTMAIGIQTAETLQAQTRQLDCAEDVLCVRVTPDGRLLAVALLDATVKVYYLDRWGGLAAATPGAP